MKRGTPSKVKTIIPRGKKKKVHLPKFETSHLSPKLFSNQVNQIIQRERGGNLQRALSLEEVSSTTTHLKMDEASKQIKQREENDFSKSTKLRRSLINDNMPQDG
jgi:hypothetical protein